jgi:hypothetical protein
MGFGAVQVIVMAFKCVLWSIRVCNRLSSGQDAGIDFLVYYDQDYTFTRRTFPSKCTKCNASTQGSKWKELK